MQDLAYWTIVVLLIAVIVSVAFSALALLKALIPPQQRQVRELRSEVEELADDVDQVHGRLNERAARANMELAREKKRQRGDLVAEAQQILQQQPAAAKSPDEIRADLRRKHLQ